MPLFFKHSTIAWTQTTLCFSYFSCLYHSTWCFSFVVIVCLRLSISLIPSPGPPEEVTVVWLTCSYCGFVVEWVPFQSFLKFRRLEPKPHVNRYWRKPTHTHAHVTWAYETWSWRDLKERFDPASVPSATYQCTIRKSCFCGQSKICNVVWYM